MKLVHVLTAPNSLGFLRGQLRYMAAQGLDVHLIASLGEDARGAFAAQEGVDVRSVPMTRDMTPLPDLLSLWRLYRLIGALDPDIVQAGTPKAGFLGMVAAVARRVPIRVYHMHGIRGMTAEGWRRRLLMTTERLACRLSTRVLCVSASTRQTAIAEGLCPSDKIVVLGAGSCNGVDARDRFDPSRFDAPARLATRVRLNIPPSAPVIGFVGRIVRDKGIGELAVAWGRLAAQFPDLHLLLVGEEETEDPVPATALTALRDHPRTRFVPWVADPAPLYAVMDVVALPTHREGLPYVPLEAAAMRLPVVASRVDGCVDAIVDGVTGTLVPPGAAQPLADALAVYLRDPALRERHGTAGRARVLRDFIPQDVWRGVLALYQALCQTSSHAPPASQAVR